MQINCTLLQTDNHTSTISLNFFTGRMPFLTPNQQRQSTILYLPTILHGHTLASMAYVMKGCIALFVQFPSTTLCCKKNRHPFCFCDYSVCCWPILKIFVNIAAKEICNKIYISNFIFTHTHTLTQPFYGPLGFCPGLSGWAGTRKVKPIWIYCSKK